MRGFARRALGMSRLGVFARMVCVMVGVGGCLAAAEGTDSAQAEPTLAEEQALTAWQCAPCGSDEYVHSVSLSQGNALGCAGGPAYRCELIPWASRASFAHCGDAVSCPPGWHVSGAQSGPSYCGGISGRTTCSAVPYPSGTYLTCDPICYPGFTETTVSVGVPSCDYQDKRTCVK